MSNKIKVTIEIDPQLEQDLIITAYEGGSTYWATLSGRTIDRIDRTVSPKSGLAPSERFYQAMQVGKAFGINDAENPKRRLGLISRTSMDEAWNILATDYSKTFGDIISGNWDAWSADTFFQLAVMGDVVYGQKYNHEYSNY